jgi:hypothetical protein
MSNSGAKRLITNLTHSSNAFITYSLSTNYWSVQYLHTPPQYGAIPRIPTIVIFKLFSRNVFGLWATTQGAPPFLLFIPLLISNPHTSLYTVCRKNFSTNVLSIKTPSSARSETIPWPTSSIGTKNIFTNALNTSYCNSTRWLLQCFLFIVW